MIHVTEVLDSSVYDAQGNYVGRVRELCLVPAEQPNRIARLVISRGRYQPLVARYDQVASVAPGTVRLNAGELQLGLYEPNEGWLTVRKDLLDQQIIDIHGRKVVRVNDVGRIRLLQKRLPTRVIPWEFVDVIETDPLRRVKLKLEHSKLARLHPADIADIIEELAPAQREAVIQTLDSETAAEAF